MIPDFFLLALVAVAAILIILLPRRWLVLALLAWTASPLAVFIGVVAWETMTRPDVTHSFENALLGFSMVSAIFIIPWGIVCAVSFAIGFALRRLIRGHEPPKTTSSRNHAAPTPAVPAHILATALAAKTRPVLKMAVPVVSNDVQQDAAEWRQAHIGFEMDDLMIGGLGVWSHA